MINAFTLGAQSVNPKVVVHVRWSGSYDDEAQDKKTANSLMDQFPVDVISTNQSIVAVLEAADARGVKSVGYNIAHTDMFPNTFLTAPVWYWGEFY